MVCLDTDQGLPFVFRASLEQERPSEESAMRENSLENEMLEVGKQDPDRLDRLLAPHHNEFLQRALTFKKAAGFPGPSPHYGILQVNTVRPATWSGGSRTFRSLAVNHLFICRSKETCVDSDQFMAFFFRLLHQWFLSGCISRCRTLIPESAPPAQIPETKPEATAHRPDALFELP